MLPRSLAVGALFKFYTNFAPTRSQRYPVSRIAVSQRSQRMVSIRPRSYDPAHSERSRLIHPSEARSW